MKRWTLRLLALLLVLGGVGYALRAPLSLLVAERVVARKLASDGTADLPDGLHVGLCGAGSPFPDDRRAGPCTLVLAGKRLFVFDAGSGSVRNIGKMGFSHGGIEAIFLTHFHSDHIDGLGELMLQRWVSASRPSPVPVYGPQGVEQVITGLMQAYTLDRGYRVAHHGEATMPVGGMGGQAKTFAAGSGELHSLLKDADLEISSFRVDHAPIDQAVGYKISYKGRSVVISGDTKKSAAVQRAAEGVDLLIHEALSVPLVNMLRSGAEQAGRKNLVKIFGDITDYHASPEQAAETARDARVGYLMLNHIVPPLPLPGMEKAFLGEAGKIYPGGITVGADGDFVSLPSGSKDIRVGRRFQ